MKLFKRKMGKKQKAALNALADGIECGAKLRPQVKGSLCKPVERGGYEYGSCALGAAMECALVKEGMTDVPQRLARLRALTEYQPIMDYYGVTDKPSERHVDIEDYFVLATGMGDAIATLIYKLNDSLGWSRERIAAFLRELE